MKKCFVVMLVMVSTVLNQSVALAGLGASTHESTSVISVGIEEGSSKAIEEVLELLCGEGNANDEGCAFSAVALSVLAYPLAVGVATTLVIGPFLSTTATVDEFDKRDAEKNNPKRDAALEADLQNLAQMAAYAKSDATQELLGAGRTPAVSDVLNTTRQIVDAYGTESDIKLMNRVSDQTLLKLLTLQN